MGGTFEAFVDRFVDVVAEMKSEVAQHAATLPLFTPDVPGPYADEDLSAIAHQRAFERL